MRLKPEDKQAIGNRIVAGAAKILRARGYEQVNLDAIMKEASLTRGAFYAHFESKTDLFQAVVRNEHPILRMLKARDGKDAGSLRAQLLEVFAGYLDPANLEQVFQGCTVASLTGDVTRAQDDIKKAYEAAWDDIVDEMARGETVSNKAALRSAFTLASGAVSTAMASHSDHARAEILTSALHFFRELIAVGLTTSER